MNNLFEIGDIVQLKSGGPKMTVKKTGTKTNNIGTPLNPIIYECECVWFLDDKPYSKTFDQSTLIKTNEIDK